MKAPAKKRISKTGTGEKQIKLLISRREPCEIRYTSNTTRIETEDNIFTFSTNFLKWKDLGFIGRCRSHAEGLDPDKYPFEDVKSSEIDYYRFSRHLQGTYHEVTELDVNAAYWELARRKGFISEKLYAEGLTVNKKVRLIALGAFATRYNYFTYDGSEKEPQYQEERPTDTKKRVASYFFQIAKELSEIMCSTQNNIPGVLMFWTDAFFVLKSSAPAIKEAIESHGLKLKEKAIDRIEIVKEKEGTQFRCYMEDDEFGYKPFYIPTPGRRQYLISEAVKFHNSRED